MKKCFYLLIPSLLIGVCAHLSAADQPPEDPDVAQARAVSQRIIERMNTAEARVVELEAQLAQLQQERDAALAAQGSIANATISQVQGTLPQQVAANVVAELEKLKTP